VRGVERVDAHPLAAALPQDAALARNEREDMSRRDDVAIVFCRVDGCGDGMRAVMGGDTGGDTLAGFNGDGEIGRVPRLV